MLLSSLLLLLVCGGCCAAHGATSSTLRMISSPFFDGLILGAFAVFKISIRITLGLFSLYVSLLNCDFG